MVKDNKILVAKSESKEIYLLPKMANRHGLITGATGTGKTVTLKVIAESFSKLGVPVFLSDVKGDLASLCKKGDADNENVSKRIVKLGIEDEFKYTRFPVRFFDVLQEKGHPVRVTISDMGPTLLSRLMSLNDTQTGVMNIVFRVADDNNLILDDLKDLRAMLNYVSEHNAEYQAKYGNVAKASVGAIQRAMLVLEDAGGDIFFGEPMLDINDFFGKDERGYGYINILDSVKIFNQPLIYSTFLLWLLSELYENLPEVGDCDLPKLVFFFDEAHLLFEDCPKALLTKITQIVKLVRSKGVGVYFVSQNPTDIPDEVLAQLSNRVQHALRAYTPKELKIVKAAAESFRENPEFDTTEAITSLSTGEALISFLDEKGIPEIVERATVLPPESYMDTIDEDLRKEMIEISDVYGKYEETVDDVSAYEQLQGAQEEAEEETTNKKDSSIAKTVGAAAAGAVGVKAIEKAITTAGGTLIREASKDAVNAVTGKKKSKNSKSAVEKALNAGLSSVSTNLGRNLTRGLLGILSGNK